MKKNLIPSCLSSDVKNSVGHMRPCYSPTLVLSRSVAPVEACVMQFQGAAAKYICLPTVFVPAETSFLEMLKSRKNTTYSIVLCVVGIARSDPWQPTILEPPLPNGQIGSKTHKEGIALLLSIDLCTRVEGWGGKGRSLSSAPLPLGSGPAPVGNGGTEGRVGQDYVSSELALPCAISGMDVPPRDGGATASGAP